MSTITGRRTPLNGWCILRTAGPRTLPLLASLHAAHIDAWTPVATIKRRVPRKSGMVEKTAAMMPTFVFARADSAADLMRMSRSPMNPHPAFALFRFDGRVPIVSDREIEALRLAEQRAVPKAKRPTLTQGSTVRPREGAYAGLDGVVKTSDGQYTLVAFGGWMDVKIETLLLLGDEIGTLAA